MTSITDRLTIPKEFVFPTGCGFQISVPSTWGVTGPTFPTDNLVLLTRYAPLGMHHLDETITINPITNRNPIQHPC